jgi:hypothetical protein
MYSVQDAPVEWQNPEYGTNKVNAAFQVANLVQPTPAVGTNIWLASLVFHIDWQEIDWRNIILQLEIADRGSVLRNADYGPVPPTSVALSTPLLLFRWTPEPATGTLLAFGIAASALARRRASARGR